jgi:quercetin dioxygenase-like cupin family protein
VKRDPALVPLSHDHHHGLVEARRLRRAAAGDRQERRRAAAAFLRFFAAETRRHFREEEERIFPLLVDAEAPAGELLARALLEHQRLYALTGELENALAAGDVPTTQMQQLADTLEEHIRFEERTLFPLIEQVASRSALRRLQEAESGPSAVELLTPEGEGPLWGAETEDLNATLLAWPGGGGTSEHVNSERDVLVVVLSGSAIVTVDGEALPLDAGKAVVIEKGRERKIAAGPEGVRYLSVHVRRPKLQISSAPPR